MTNNDENDKYFNQIKTLNNDDSMGINFYLTTNTDGQSGRLNIETVEEKQLNINLAMDELNSEQMDGNKLNENDGTVCLELYDNEHEPSISRLIAAVQSKQSSNLNHLDQHQHQHQQHHHHSEISLSFKPDPLVQHESTLLVYVPENLEFIPEKQDEKVEEKLKNDAIT